MSFGKLADALPLLVGRTIERTVVVEHADGRFSVYLLFDDRSVYEFYGENVITGRRHIDAGTLDDVIRWSATEGRRVLVSPDRRTRPRG